MHSGQNIMATQGHIDEFDRTVLEKWDLHATKLKFYHAANKVTNPWFIQGHNGETTRTLSTISIRNSPPANGPSSNQISGGFHCGFCHCRFLDLETLLHGWFVCGLRDKELQQRLFTKKDLTFQATINEALAS